MKWVQTFMEKISGVFSEKKTDEKQEAEFPIFYDPQAGDEFAPELSEQVVVKEKPKKDKKKKKTTRKKKKVDENI